MAPNSSWWSFFVACFVIAVASELDFAANNAEELVVEGLGGKFNLLEEDGVVVLTGDNFDYYVLSRPLVLVEFYAPWCGHCRELAPEFARAATLLRGSNTSLAKVDCTKEQDLAKTHDVNGYPSLYLYANGRKIDDYRGPRNAQAIVDYLKQKSDPNWKAPASAVLELTGANFDRTVRNAELMLVQFYAPWCKHCQQMEAEYELAAKSLAEFGIRLGRVNGPAEKELADSLHVGAWPTLKVFRKGRSFDYRGTRQADGIVEEMRKLWRPASRRVASAADLRHSIGRNETTVVGFFAGANDFYEEFVIAVQELRGVMPVLHTFDEELATAYDVNVDTVVVMQPAVFHSKYEKPSYEYARHGATAEDLLKFIRETSTPLVGQRTKANQAFKYANRPLIVIYYDVSFDHRYVADAQRIRRQVVEVAQQYQPHQVRFALSNEDEYIDELRALGLADAYEDVKVAAYTKDMKFRMDPVDDFSGRHLQEFLDRLNAGTMRPYFKSQPVPKGQQGDVRVVVADTFADEVLKSKKDVLIEFYAPWCAACKSLAADYAKLGRRMRKLNADLVVAKMDATANDVHPMFGALRGYPSIFFVAVHAKDDPVHYQGQHNYKALKAFVEENASVILSEEERLGLAGGGGGGDGDGDQSASTGHRTADEL